MAIGDVTRLTSANLHIEFQPALYPRMRSAAYAAYDTEMNHVTVLSLNGAASGTFKLAINGKKTAAITASGSLASSAVQTAIEAVVGAGNMTVTGSAGGPFTLTAAATLLNEFLVIEIVDCTGACIDVVSQAITSQGSKWYRLDAEARNFSFSGSQEATDVTGISESSRREQSTVSDATFDMGLYECKQSYRAILLEGVEGYLRVFPDGKLAGNPYFAWEVLLKDANESFEAFEKIEIDVSGRRQGAPIARIGSIW